MKITLANYSSKYLTNLLYVYTYFFHFLAQEPPVGQGPLIHEVSRSHSTTHHSRTPLDEGSARPTDLYLTTHNTQTDKKKVYAPRWDSKPQSQHASDGRPTI